MQLNERFSEQTNTLFKLFDIFDHSSPNFFNPDSPYLKILDDTSHLKVIDARCNVSFVAMKLFRNAPSVIEKLRC